MSYQVVSRLAIVFSFTLIACSAERELEIIPISPYKEVWWYTEHTETIELTFALKNFSYNQKNMILLDSFVKSNLPNDYLQEYRAIQFLFYKYEKGKIDENFVNKEEPKQQNLSMGESGAEKLVNYEWQHGKFMSVKIYKNNQYYKKEKRNW